MCAYLHTDVLAYNRQRQAGDSPHRAISVSFGVGTQPQYRPIVCWKVTNVCTYYMDDELGRLSASALQSHSVCVCVRVHVCVCVPYLPPYCSQSGACQWILNTMLSI